MAVTIGEMNVEVAPAATTSAPGAGSGSGAASGAGPNDSAALHRMMLLLHERKSRLKTS